MITTACNAATMPVIGPYLDELQKWLAAEGFGGSVLMMLSNGGVVSADDAARAPIRLVESGPAAGALAGSWFARRLGEDRLLCFDMGGTTAKSCLIVDGEPELTNTFEVARIYRFKKGSGFPVSVPSVDLVEIGAGGGSLARIDDLGLLKVGPGDRRRRPGTGVLRPRWRRARPSPTPTSRSGMLDAGYFLGGDMPLDLAANERGAGDASPTALGLPVGDTAAGIHELVNQNMAAVVPDARRRAGRRPPRRAPCSRSAAPARSTPAASPSCSSRRGSSSRQRQRAVGVRHARHAGAHRPRPQHGPAARRDRPGRARRAARRAARRGRRVLAAAGVADRPHPLPLRARRPLPRPGQRDHDLGRRGRRVAGDRRARSSPRSRATTGGSTA